MQAAHAADDAFNCVPLAPERVVPLDALAVVSNALKSMKKDTCKVVDLDQYMPRLPDLKITKALCKPEKVYQICEVTKAFAKHHTTSSYAFGALAQKTGSICPAGQGISDDQLVRHREKAFQYTALKFKLLTQDPAMQFHCCGNNQNCKERWSATKLHLVVGLGVESQLAQIRQNTIAEIELSTGRIANCFTADCIDKVLLHELGHSCRRWQKESSEQKLRTPSFEETARDLSDYIGKDGADCVTKGLHSYYNGTSGDFRKRVNLDRWADEAFADIVFAGEWGTAGLVWICDGQEDETHADPKAYIGCFIYDPKFKNKFCTQDE